MISLQEYEIKKQKLIAELKIASRDGSPALGKSTSNLYRHRVSDKKRKINVRHFSHVIAIDPQNLVAEVEGMASYEAIVNETLKFGLMPAVVPELKSITIGGAATGVGLESSSFKYGFVHETIEEIEILLGSGDTEICSRSQNADLFHGFPNSYGTLGYALKVKVKLIPVKKYVKITNHRYSSTEEWFKGLGEICAAKPDFIDGIAFAADEMYIASGKFSDEAPVESDYSYLDIYYRSIRQKEVDYLSVYNYLWRWDTDWYWHSRKYLMHYRLLRRIVGKKNLGSAFYQKVRDVMAKSGFFWTTVAKFYPTESVIQDVEIPLERSAQFMDFIQKEIGIWPIWICPVKTYDRASTFPLYPVNHDTMYVNFGIWDLIHSKREQGFYNRKIEKQTMAHGGIKMLYSTSFFSQEDFERAYNFSEAQKLKAKYDPGQVFKNLYEKCVLNRIEM